MSRGKFVIQPFKHNLTMDLAAAQQTWRTLASAIQQIHQHNASGLSFEELYRNAYNMVLHKHGDLLYQGLVDTITQHLATVAIEIAAAPDSHFLPLLHERWEEHKLSSVMIRDILMYMDRTFVAAQKKKPVYEAALAIFRDEVCRHPRIRERLLETLLSLVARERDGELVPRALVKAIAAGMLVDLSREVYRADFEEPLLRATAAYYAHESNETLAQSSASDYMRRVERRLCEEEERVVNYLDPLSKPRIKEVVERELIARHMAALAHMEHSGILAMLEDDKYEDLARAYALFRRVRSPDGLGVIRDLMVEHVKVRGERLVAEVAASPHEPLVYVRALLALRDKYAAIIERSLGADKLFYNALNAAFETFVNTCARSPEYLSLLVDELMRRGMRGTSEEDVDVQLDKVVMLFRYLQEKDVFEKWYKQHLAKRLLGGRSLSDEIERQMIQKLKVECGYQFTSNLEQMFIDIKMSADTLENFRRAHGSSKVEGIELIVHVLNGGVWPSGGGSAGGGGEGGQAAAAQGTDSATGSSHAAASNNDGCILPAPLARCCEAYRAHYLKQHEGRRLTWQPSMGSAELRARFSAKHTHEVNVSTYMMCILLLFNECDRLSYTDIAAATGICEAHLKRALQSLACGKYKLLSKEPRSREVDATDDFCFNTAFTCKQLKFKVSTISSGGGAAASDGEQRAMRKKVDDDRKPQIEAAIVRIMKARKELDHNALIADVIAQLAASFLPHPNVIKQRIESLIEREFLERDRNNMRVYRYLA